MATRFFNFTLPATTNYYSVWSQIQAAIAAMPANAQGFVPNQGYELVLCADSVIIKVADGFNPTTTTGGMGGVPVQATGNLTLRSTRNTVDLKELWVTGSGAAISCAFSWL